MRAAPSRRRPARVPSVAIGADGPISSSDWNPGRPGRFRALLLRPLCSAQGSPVVSVQGRLGNRTGGRIALSCHQGGRPELSRDCQGGRARGALHPTGWPALGASTSAMESAPVLGRATLSQSLHQLQKVRDLRLDRDGGDARP